MSYATSLYGSAGEVPAEDWDALNTNAADPFMDRRFLTAVERSMSTDGKFFYIIVRDDAGRTMATAALCAYRIDGAVLAGPTLKRFTEAVRRVWPSYARLKVLFCGLPVSAGQKQLRLHPQADAAQVMAELDAVLRQIAKRERVWFIVAKEFEQADLPSLESLRTHGYVLADSLPMNHFEPRFTGLDDYCRALRSHYRYKIKKSLRKFDAAGLRVETLVDPDEILAIYTDELHKLYYAVVDRAESKLEILPPEFFRQLVRQLPGEVSLSLIRQGERIVAFGWGLTRGGAYRSLFIGVDYSLNAEVDLYFNTMLRGIDGALRSGVSDIYVGQAADDFKARIGCHQQPRYLYLKSPSRLIHAMFRPIARFIFPKPPLPPPHELFKPQNADAPAEAANA